MVKTVCSFINPKMAKEVFDSGEVSDNSGFLEDIKKMDPNFNEEEYQDVLESMS